MNINLIGEIFVVGKKEQVSTNGQQVFYSLAIATEEGDAGNLSCSKEVFDSVKPMSKYKAAFTYRDGQYKGIRIYGVEALRDTPTK